MKLLDASIASLHGVIAPELRGRVSELRGMVVTVRGLLAPVGTQVLLGQESRLEGEVVAFDGQCALVMPLGDADGLSPGDDVVAIQPGQTIGFGPGLLGRVLDFRGRPIDGLRPLDATWPQPLRPRPISALDRPVVDQPLATGCRVIDALLPVGRGQRMGLFAAPGVGKSTLMAQIARCTDATVCVVGLIGERGREVNEFVQRTLGPEGLQRSVVVAATGDEPPLARLRAAETATAIAEGFRDQGEDVLLLLDSVTRYAHAQRQVGLAAGEPPATRGYPPSVFARLPQLMERAGRTSTGSITAFYAVLVEGEDFDEPIADCCRGVLDGHILLTRKLAEKGHHPAVDVLASVSRCAPELIDADHQSAITRLRRLLAAYAEVEELIQLGAYAAGSDPDADLAIAAQSQIERLLRQGRGETPRTGAHDGSAFERTRGQLMALQAALDAAQTQLRAAGVGTKVPG